MTRINGNASCSNSFFPQVKLKFHLQKFENIILILHLTVLKRERDWEGYELFEEKMLYVKKINEYI